MTKKKVVEKSKNELRLEVENDKLKKKILEVENSYYSARSFNNSVSNELREAKENLRIATQSNDRQSLVNNDLNRILLLKDTSIDALNQKILQLGVAFHSTIQLQSSLQHDLVDVIGKDNFPTSTDTRNLFREDRSV